MVWLYANWHPNIVSYVLQDSFNKLSCSRISITWISCIREANPPVFSVHFRCHDIHWPCATQFGMPFVPASAQYRNNLMSLSLLMMVQLIISLRAILRFSLVDLYFYLHLPFLFISWFPNVSLHGGSLLYWVLLKQ